MKNILISIFLLILGITNSLAQPNANAGKIWISGNKLFINSPFKGVQVMDNSNPRRPEPIGFVAIPNNVDFAVFDNIMYANHNDDLVVFDWEAYIDDSELIELERFEGLFPKYSSSPELAMGMLNNNIKRKSKSTGGSQSCFSFNDSQSPNFLYAANETQIHVINVKEKDDPKQGQSISVNNNFQIETVFTEGERLFLGMPNGMLVYSLDNPSQPSPRGTYSHMVGCDPVVAKGNTAYVTVRSGSTCNSNMTLNQLHIVDISSNSSRYQSSGSFQLQNPHGLGIDGNLLFICDGSAGLKVLDVTNPRGIRLLSHMKTPSVAYDVIVESDKRKIIVVSGDHIIQYKYSSTGTLRKLGEFKLDYSEGL